MRKIRIVTIEVANGEAKVIGVTHSPNIEAAERTAWNHAEMMGWEPKSITGTEETEIVALDTLTAFIRHTA